MPENPEKTGAQGGGEIPEKTFPVGFSDKAAEYIKLQEQFAERAREPYWRDRQKRIEKAGYAGKQLEMIRNKIVEIDRLFSGVDWKKNVKARQTLEQELEAKSAEQARERVFAEIGGMLEKLSAREWEIIRENFDVKRERAGAMDDIDREMLSENEAELRQIAESREALCRNPETALYARMAELSRYQRELNQNGFAVTPSRQNEIRWVEEKIEEGQPIFLEGPTGTGKTELAKHAAKELYGAKVEGLDLVIRCTQRTGPADIFGKILLRSKEGTETYFQPGKFVVAADRGVPVIFDEINNMESSQRLGLKEFFNIRPGQTISLQEDSGKAHVVEKGFSIVATANLKNEKHKTREELGTEETRVFAMRHIDYMPREELYDLCLASMMGREGEIWAKPTELRETLKNLCDAAEEIQDAYNGAIGFHYNARMKEEAERAGVKPDPKKVKDEKSYGLVGSKTKKGLEKAVLDPGQVVRIVRGFQGKVGLSLKKHVEQSLLEFVKKGDYPESDRDLLVRILLTKGFWPGAKASDFGLTALDDAQIAALSGGGARKETEKNTKAQKSPDKPLSLKQAAALDPYGRYKVSADMLAEDFLEQAPQPYEGDKRFRKMPDELSVEFADPASKRKETITLHFEQAFQRWSSFFESKGVALPPDFEKVSRAVWDQNYEAIKEEIERFGYDGILIIPGNLSLPDLRRKMTEGYDETWQSDDFKEGGSFAGVKSPGANKARIVLYHEKNAKELNDNPIIREFVGKNLMQITGLTLAEIEAKIANGEPLKGKTTLYGQSSSFEGWSAEDYLAIQAEYFSRTGQHLDETKYTWLLGSTCGRRVPGLSWSPDGGRLAAYAASPGRAAGGLAVRPAAVFNLVSEIRDFSDFDFNISAEFQNPTDNSSERISLDFEKEAKYWSAFYSARGIDTPADFAEQIADVVERNRAEIEKAVAEFGYDRAIIVPPGISAPDLHRKMTEGYNETWQSDNFKEGGFGGIETANSDKTRIILVHENNARNNAEHWMLKELRGKSVQVLSGLSRAEVQKKLDKGETIPLQAEVNGKKFTFTGLDVPAYLAWQRAFFDKTHTHLDESGWSLLPGSSITSKGKKGGRRVPELSWPPGFGRLGAGASSPGSAAGHLAVRPAAVFS